MLSNLPGAFPSLLCKPEADRFLYISGGHVFNSIYEKFDSRF